MAKDPYPQGAGVRGFANWISATGPAVMNDVTEFSHHLISRTSETQDIARRVQDQYRQTHDPEFTLDPLDQVHYVAALYHAVRFFQPERVLQIGTFTGVSLVAMLTAASDCDLPIEVTTIDPEPEQYFMTRRPVQIARKVVEANRYDRRVRFIQGYSCAASEKNGAPEHMLAKLDASYHMLVVDGDHSFRGAYNDLKIGESKLENNSGVVIVHDYNGIPEVRAAVDLWINQSKCVQHAFSTEHRCGLVVAKVEDSKNGIGAGDKHYD